jgi:hypothetical protein
VRLQKQIKLRQSVSCGAEILVFARGKEERILAGRQAFTRQRRGIKKGVAVWLHQDHSDLKEQS